ncbi:hypothetical protein DM02DRAFT_322715 [Periconia macrospinosa]|uniref:Uncharacterized protein n=1 Tax=Periconia macrospinosa TaxID=97972 RepID=A0A2V1ECC9_9PLEO|nr:hypothetical protein DM02DRAFT_322715 [Periconia macrospinosa]
MYVRVCVSVCVRASVPYFSSFSFARKTSISASFLCELGDWGLPWYVRTYTDFYQHLLSISLAILQFLLLNCKKNKLWVSFMDNYCVAMVHSTYKYCTCILTIGMLTKLYHAFSSFVSFFVRKSKLLGKLHGQPLGAMVPTYMQLHVYVYLVIDIPAEIHVPRFLFLCRE